MRRTVTSIFNAKTKTATTRPRFRAATFGGSAVRTRFLGPVGRRWDNRLSLQARRGRDESSTRHLSVCLRVDDTTLERRARRFLCVTKTRDVQRRPRGGGRCGPERKTQTKKKKKNETGTLGVLALSIWQCRGTNSLLLFFPSLAPPLLVPLASWRSKRRLVFASERECLTDAQSKTT